MSKLACHTKKFKTKDIRGMQIHNQRETENSSNPDIDRERTAENYDIRNPNGPISYNNRVNQILAAGYRGEKEIRSDAVKMVSVLVTAERDFFDRLSEAEQRRFFHTAASHLADRYGLQNVVAAPVHMDEKTPHMHFYFVPLTQDGRLCAKEVTDKQELTRLQDDLPKILQKAGFEIERGEPKAKTKAIHRDTADWKREQQKLTKELENTDKLLQNRVQELQSREQILIMAEHEIKQREGQIRAQEQVLKNKEFDLLILDEMLSEKAAVLTTKQKEIDAETAKADQRLALLTEAKAGRVQSPAVSRYEEYLFKGYTDKECAQAMIQNDKFAKEVVAKVISDNSPNAPGRSDQAREYGRKTVAGIDPNKSFDRGAGMVLGGSGPEREKQRNAIREQPNRPSGGLSATQERDKVREIMEKLGVSEDVAIAIVNKSDSE